MYFLIRERLYIMIEATKVLFIVPESKITFQSTFLPLENILQEQLKDVIKNSVFSSCAKYI